MDDGAGQCRPLLFSAGEFVGAVCPPMSQADTLQSCGGPTLSLHAVDSSVHQREGDVLDQSEMGNEMEGLEDEPDPKAPSLRTFLLFEVGHLLAGQDVSSRRRPIEKAEDLQQGGFARARGAGQCQPFPVVDLEIDAGQGGDITIGPAAA